MLNQRIRIHPLHMIDSTGYKNAYFRISGLLARTGLLAALVGAAWLSGCKGTPSPDPAFAQDQTYLASMVERRFTPLDSVTRFHTFDQTGRVLQVDFLRNYVRNPYSVHHRYEPYSFAKLANLSDQYIFHQFNSDYNPTSARQYFAPTRSHWFVCEWDTLIYQQRRLLRQDHRDYAFRVDGYLVAFPFPLWLTKRYFVYGQRQRLEAYVDSTFISYDIPKGSFGIQSTPARYVCTNHTRFIYNQRGELSQQVSYAEGASVEQLRYDNGSSVTTFMSWPGQFLAGTTSYSYVYRGDGRVAQQVIDFEDQRTKGVYRSELRYQYSTPK